MPTTPTTRRLKGPTCREGPPISTRQPAAYATRAPFHSWSCSHLNVDAGPQQVAHLLQDLFLQRVPGHHAVHVEHERQPEPAARAQARRFRRP